MLQQFIKRIKQYNQPLPLLDYFIPLIGNKKEVKIADIGSGPYPITGQLLDGVRVEVYPSDKQDFTYFWNNYKTVPMFPIEIQNMEKLTYEDNFFDIVHCVNALDHTADARAAIKEMIRVVKPGGWIYISCYLDQLVTGHKHYWDTKEDGVLVNPKGELDLKSFGFNIKFIDNHGERRYNKIIATYEK